MLPQANTESSPVADRAARMEMTRLRALVHLLDSENGRLRALLAHAEAQLAEGRAAAERAALEPHIRAAFGLSADAPVNWPAVAQWCAAARALPPPAPEPPATPDAGGLHGG